MRCFTSHCFRGGVFLSAIKLAIVVFSNACYQAQMGWLWIALHIGAMGVASFNCEETLSVSVNFDTFIAPIMSSKCAICHAGPYLNLTRFPFHSDRFSSQEALAEEIIRRTTLTDGKRMPPVNCPALSEAELNLLQRWFDEGLH